MTEEEREELRCDVMLFVTTSTEVEQLCDVAKHNNISFNKRSIGGLSFFSMGTIGTSKVNAVRTKMGAFGFDGSASKALHYKVAMGAQAIIQVGMAFGLNEREQRIGDVLISTVLYPYDLRTITKHEEANRYRVNYEEVVPHPAKESLLRMFRRHLSRSPPEGYKVWPGGIVSGGARIYCEHFVTEVLATLPGVEDGIPVGGEMEGVGLLSVSERKDPQWIVVKGICDFANDKRDAVIEESRPVACRNAASLVLGALSEPLEDDADGL